MALTGAPDRAQRGGRFETKYMRVTDTMLHPYKFCSSAVVTPCLAVQEPHRDSEEAPACRADQF